MTAKTWGLGWFKVHGYVTVQEVENELTWKAGRALDALENLMRVTSFPYDFGWIWELGFYAADTQIATTIDWPG